MYSLAYFHRNQEGKLDEHLWNAYNAASTMPRHLHEQISPLPMRKPRFEKMK